VANLYLTEQGSILRKTGDRLIGQKEGEILLDVPCNKIEAILIFGNVQFTTQAVHELFENGIEMAILTRTGRLIGQITSPATKNIELRVLQFKRYDDTAFRRNLSKALVTGKVFNCLTLLKAFSYNHPKVGLSGEISGLELLIKDISTSDNAASLRGLEGNAA